MTKFRILEIVNNVNHYSDEKHHFIIEKYNWWKWIEIKRKEVSSTLITFVSYQEAEQYMINNFMKGYGWYKKDNNVYSFEAYSYSF